jgi:hypothetical protein
VRKSARIPEKAFPVYIYKVLEMNNFERTYMTNVIKNILMESEVEYEKGSGGVPF